MCSTCIFSHSNRVPCKRQMKEITIALFPCEKCSHKSSWIAEEEGARARVVFHFCPFVLFPLSLPGQVHSLAASFTSRSDDDDEVDAGVGLLTSRQRRTHSAVRVKRKTKEEKKTATIRLCFHALRFHARRACTGNDVIAPVCTQAFADLTKPARKEIPIIVHFFHLTEDSWKKDSCNWAFVLGLDNQFEAFLARKAPLWGAYFYTFHSTSTNVDSTQVDLFNK